MTPAKLRGFVFPALRWDSQRRTSKIFAPNSGITRQTLYRFVSPTGELRDDAKRLLLKRRVAGRPN
jgi:hypothetical protein